jgi:hypothetical protein
VFLQRHICGVFSSPTVIGSVFENLRYLFYPPSPPRDVYEEKQDNISIRGKIYIDCA